MAKELSGNTKKVYDAMVKKGARSEESGRKDRKILYTWMIQGGEGMNLELLNKSIF
ncbi:MAG: hypothetical protein WBD09_03580 [Halobacteriota archaeon]